MNPEDIINKRIEELLKERHVLENMHNALVQENQRINQEFQQRTVKNQTRFAQMSGAITELQMLVTTITKKETNHDNRISSFDLSDRPVDVRVGEQPEGC